jgi:hypothetical protein
LPSSDRLECFFARLQAAEKGEEEKQRNKRNLILELRVVFLPDGVSWMALKAAPPVVGKTTEEDGNLHVVVPAFVHSLVPFFSSLLGFDPLTSTWEIRVFF